MNKASKEYSGRVEYSNISSSLNISVVKQYLVLFNHPNNLEYSVNSYRSDEQIEIP